jgi:hypothetical protein
MASSSLDLSNSSTESETSQEMTPKFNSKAAYEAYTPLHWDTEEWDFWAWSEDDESLTDGEDIQFLLDGELEDEDDDDDVSWEGTTPPRKRRMTMSRPRRTRQQGVSCAPGHLMKTTTEMTAGTPMTGTLMTEPTVMMAPPGMMVSERMAAAVAAMMMAMSARFLQSSAIDSQAPTGGSVSVDVSSR